MKTYFLGQPPAGTARRTMAALAVSLAAATCTIAAAAPSVAESALATVIEGVDFDPANRADFAIPEAPAAVVLGQSASLLRPATPRQTLTSVLANFDQGKLKSGFALGITPYSQFRSKAVSLREYNEDGMIRFLTRLQVSIAAKTGADATTTTAATPSTFGVGMSGVFFDDADSRLDEKFRHSLEDLIMPIAKAFQTPENQAKIAQGKDVDAPIAQAYFTQYEAIKKAAESKRWNAAAMGFGYAVRFKSVSGKVEDAKEDGGGAWLNLALPGVGAFKENSQFLLTANYRYHDAFTRAGTTGVEDSFNAGAQWRTGTASFNVYAELFHHWRSPKGSPKTSDTTWELGLEKKLVDGLWLNLAYSNDDHLTGGKQVKTGLRYGFGKAAALGK